MTVTLFQALSGSSKGWLAVSGADFLLPGLVGTGWGRAGLQEAGWFMYSQSITTPEPKEPPALQPGEQCWHQLYEPLFFFSVCRLGAVLKANFFQLPPAFSFCSCLLSAFSEDTERWSCSDSSPSCRSACEQNGGLCSREIPV